MSTLSLNYILAISGGVVVFVAMMIVAFYLMFRHLSSIDLTPLPRKIRATYEHFQNRPERWKKEVKDGHTPYWWLFLTPGSTKWKNMQSLFNRLGGKSLKIKKAFAIYNRTLLQNFINARKIMADRFEHQSSIFSTQKWKTDKNPKVVELRTSLMSRYEQLQSTFEWNKKTGKHKDVPIIPVRFVALVAL